MSNATIVSLMPIPFSREMIGHNPAYYAMPAAEKDSFEILHVGDATSWLYVFEGKSVQRRHLAIDEVAELIDTFIQATPLVDENAKPGIFYLEGKWSKDDIEEKFGDVLQKARDAQNLWFRNLVQDADDRWNRFHQHRDISTPARVAAKWLGLKREWNIQVEKGVNYTDCPACGTTIKASVSVCPNCRVILKEDSQFTFAS